MRVLQVIPAIAARYGGPSDSVLAISRELLRRGHDCLIATTDADGEGRLESPRLGVGEWQGVPVRFFRRTLSESFKYSGSLARWLGRHVTEYDVVHIHAVFSHSTLAASRACHAGGIPYVLRPMGSLDPETMRMKSLRKRLFWQLVGRTVAARASALHYSTPRERQAVEASLGIGHGFVVPPGIECASRPSADDQQTEAAERTPGRPYVLVLARLDPIKRIELLIDAFAEASAAAGLAAWRLVVAGDGAPSYVSRLRAHAAASGADVELVGWVSGERKDDLLRRASLFALASSHENFGRSVAEALARGVPAIVSREVYLGDLIAESDAGWMVDATRTGLVTTLRLAMSDRDLRLVKGQRAARLARESLGIDGSVDMLLAHYEKLLRGRTGPGHSLRHPTTIELERLPTTEHPS